MSSEKYQPVGGGNYRRLLPGWRRMKLDGHLWEFPAHTDPWTGRTTTLTGQGVHVPDCPRCAGERHLYLVREEESAA